jgi:diguanylate cyclase (GGDEF)-like protein
VNVFVLFLGFLLIRKVFNRIVSLSEVAKLISEGDLSQTININQPGEVGILGQTLNQLTQQIRSNMDELNNYGQKTAEINQKIQDHVQVLSQLLQISSLISQGVALEEVLKIVMQKSRSLSGFDVAYLLFRKETDSTFYMKAADAMNTNDLLKLQVKPDDRVFETLINKGTSFILDKENPASDEIASALFNKFEIKNTLAMPVYGKGKVMGIFGVGNTQDSFVFKQSERELLDILSKQIAIAVENDLLMNRIEKLEIKDALTGLYNKGYILTRLQEEIRRAIVRQRPCSFVLLNLDAFQAYRNNFGLQEAEIRLKEIAALIRNAVTEIDRVAKFGDNEFAIVLPERNKRQAHEEAEVIRKAIEQNFNKDTDPKRRLSVSGGVSENPLDGVTAEELLANARKLLLLAKKEGKNTILV